MPAACAVRSGAKEIVRARVWDGQQIGRDRAAIVALEVRTNIVLGRTTGNLVAVLEQPLHRPAIRPQDLAVVRLRRLGFG